MERLYVLLVAIAGCGRVGFESLDSDPDLTQCVQSNADDFEDGLADPQWNPFASQPSGVEETGGLLVFTTGAGEPEKRYAGYVNSPGLTNGFAQLEIVDIPDPTTAAQFIFTLNDINFVIEYGTLNFRDLRPETEFDVTMQHDASSRWIRAVEDVRSEQILWQTSPDGVTWTTRRTEHWTQDESPDIGLVGGTYAAEAIATQSRVDNFALYACP